MAFSKSKREDAVKKGELKVLITLADTSGNSDAFNLPDAVNIAIQVEGTFGGGTVTYQASNDGVTFYGLPTPVAFTAAGIKTVALADHGFLFHRLALTGGGGTTSLVCTILARLRTAGTP